jgi:integrase
MSIRKLPDGRYEWRHRVDGRHLKKTFTRRADAVAHDSKIRSDLARGTHVDTTNRTTVAEYYVAWLDGRVLRASSRMSYTSLLHNHLEPSPLASRPIVRVRPSEIQAWITDRARLLAPQTLHHYTRVLRGVFATAVLDGVIATNPVQPLRRLALPKIDKPKIVPLTVPQVQAWAYAAEPRIRAMILTQAGLGLRIAEVLALRVADVDFLRREVHITEQINRATGKRAPLKTANSRRAVPLPSVTATALAEHIRNFPPGPEGLIFTQASVTGPPRKKLPPGVWNAATVTLLYAAAAMAAGIPEGYSSHSLRHHYASVLLDAGESVHAVAERLGDRAEMVLNVYGHLMPNREDTTRHAVDAAWRAAGEVTRDVPRAGRQE